MFVFHFGLILVCVTAGGYGPQEPPRHPHGAPLQAYGLPTAGLPHSHPTPPPGPAPPPSQPISRTPSGLSRTGSGLVPPPAPPPLPPSQPPPQQVGPAPGAGGSAGASKVEGTSPGSSILASALDEQAKEEKAKEEKAKEEELTRRSKAAAAYTAQQQAAEISSDTATASARPARPSFDVPAKKPVILRANPKFLKNLGVASKQQAQPAAAAEPIASLQETVQAAAAQAVAVAAAAKPKAGPQELMQASIAEAVAIAADQPHGTTAPLMTAQPPPAAASEPASQPPPLPSPSKAPVQEPSSKRSRSHSPQDRGRSSKSESVDKYAATKHSSRPRSRSRSRDRGRHEGSTHRKSSRHSHYSPGTGSRHRKHSRSPERTKRRRSPSPLDEAPKYVRRHSGTRERHRQSPSRDFGQRGAGWGKSTGVAYDRSAHRTLTPPRAPLCNIRGPEPLSPMAAAPRQAPPPPPPPPIEYSPPTSPDSMSDGELPPLPPAQPPLPGNEDGQIVGTKGGRAAARCVPKLGKPSLSRCGDRYFVCFLLHAAFNDVISSCAILSWSALRAVGLGVGMSWPCITTATLVRLCSQSATGWKQPLYFCRFQGTRLLLALIASQ